METTASNFSVRSHPDDPIPDWYYFTPYDSTKRRVSKQNAYKAWCKVRGLECDFSALERKDH